MIDGLIVKFHHGTVYPVLFSLESIAKSHPDESCLIFGISNDVLTVGVRSGNEEIHATEWLFAIGPQFGKYDPTKFDNKHDSEFAAGTYFSEDVTGDVNKLQKRAEDFFQKRVSK